MSPPLDPSNYAPNAAWLLFRLNSAPVHTTADGDFDVYAIMDVATGLIHAMQFVAAAAELSEFESRRLLAMAEAEAGGRPLQLFVDGKQQLAQLIHTASGMGMQVVRESRKNLDPLTREAREGAAAHVLGSRMP